jgi:hypothetical protein
MQIKTTLRFCLTAVGMAIVKNTTTNKLARIWGKKEPHTLLVGM